jgi:hypothetical protein
MARPKKAISRFWSSSQAVFILERALKDRKLSGNDIRRYVGTLADEIRELEERLASLKEAAVGSAKHATRKVGAKIKTRKRALRKAVSAEVVATRKLQGQYIAHLTKFPKTARGKFQKIARTKSREEAIAAMKKSLGT